METIVTELNRTWSSPTGVLLELVRWETHTHPAFASDAQAAINHQIGDEYDLFPGILWGRFGTRTPRASSGTEEEFLRALTRHRREGMPEIMIYFKDAPIQPSRLDLAQMQKVMSFKTNVTQLGGLYSTFEDMPSFETSLRSHLSAIAQRFSTKSGPADGPVATTPKPLTDVRAAPTTARTEGLHALSNGLATRPDPESNEDGVAELAEVLRQMLATMRSTRQSLVNFVIPQTRCRA